MSTVKDLTGKKYNRLTVVKLSRIHNNAAYWLCLCDCGKETEVMSCKITSGHTKSCGCYNIERARMMGKSNVKYGKSTERLHNVWRGMIERCENKGKDKYKIYGARGISVFPEWHDYMVFREWAYSNGYNEKADKGACTIDRKNNNGNYEPNNCRFITNKEQQRNKRTNRVIVINGIGRCLKEWGELSGVSSGLIALRIDRLHWNEYDAIFTPVNKRRFKINKIAGSIDRREGIISLDSVVKEW